MFQLRKNWYTYGIYTALMALLTAITFGSLSTHLLDTDDREYIRIVARIIEDPAYLFSPERLEPMRPLTDIVWLVGYLLWKDNPEFYHIVQVVLHLMTSLFLAYAFRQLGIGLKLSLLSALFFLMNVAHFRAVHWIINLQYMLTLIAALGALIGCSRFLESGKRAWQLLAAGALAAAVFTHASAASVALFCFYMAWRKKGTIKQAISSTYLLGAVAFLFVILSYRVSPQVPQVRGIFIPPDLVSMLKYLFWYLSRLITNAHWIVAGWGNNPTFWELCAGFVLCTGTLILYRRKIFPAADWAVWAIISILPFIHRSPNWQYLPFGPSRQLYLASVGSSLALAWLILSLGRQVEIRLGKRWGQVTLCALFFGILGSSFLSLKRCEALSLYSSARSYIAYGHTEQGIQQFKRAIATDRYQTPPDTYVRTALALFGMGKSPQDILETSLTIYPNAPVLNLFLGIWHAEQQDPVLQAQGEKRIQTAFATSKEKDLIHLDAATVYYNLATHHYNSKNYRKAAAFYNKSLSFRPDSPNTMFFLGKTLYAQNLKQEALQTFRRVIQISPEHVEGHYALGILLNAQGKIDEAIHEYKKVLQIDPNHGDAYVHLAGSLYSRGKIDEALPYYRRAITFKPEDPFLYRNLAIVLIEKDELNTAIDVLKMAVDLEPNHMATWHTLGIVYNEQGHDTDALSAFQQAVRLSPDDWEAHLSLAQVYEKLDKIEDAIEEYRRTLSLNPGNIEARNSLQTLLPK